MPPDKNLVPMKSHGIMVEDERLAETEQYERQVAEEAALEREANAAAGRRSLGDRLRGWFRGSGGRGGRGAANAGTPHRFVPIDDAGLGPASIRSAGGPGGQPLGMNVAIAGNFLREQGCGVPGCGRERDDPIHFPEAE